MAQQKVQQKARQKAVVRAEHFCGRCDRIRPVIAEGAAFSVFGRTVARGGAVRLAGELIDTAACPECGHRSWMGWWRLLVLGAGKGLLVLVYLAIIGSVVSSCIPDTVAELFLAPLDAPTTVYQSAGCQVKTTAAPTWLGWLITGALLGLGFVVSVRKRMGEGARYVKFGRGPRRVKVQRIEVSDAD